MLLEAIRYASPVEIIRGQLNDDLVAGEDPDVVHSHLAGDVGKHLVPIIEFHPEHRIGQGLENGALHLYRIVTLGQVLFVLPGALSRKTAVYPIYALASSTDSLALPSRAARSRERQHQRALFRHCDCVLEVR